MRTIVFARGLPGSGKSYRAAEMKRVYDLAKVSCEIYATDDYWLRPDGIYDFNYDLISNAHMWNQRRAAKAMRADVHILIIDNVNVNWNEIKGYAKLAKLNNYAARVVESETAWKMDVEECYKHNKHGVPYYTILHMYHLWHKSDYIRQKLFEFGLQVIEERVES